ncbi:MAG: hypothetical protein K9M36_01510 [Candidatus Pacebacteria bacterium]|nr:hypothetical protein [Candidatus Paceibacterota bacterium]
MTKRLIRDIQPSQRIRAKIDARTTPEKKEITKKATPLQSKRLETPLLQGNGSSWKKGTLVFMILLIVGIVGWSFFATAVVALTPRSQDLEMRNLEIVLQKQGELSYHEIELEETETISIPATETEYQEEKASGTITIFNAHGTSSQRLLEETRFETPDGKIYKTAKGPGITVPGGKMQGGKLIPGSLDVMVYADQPGQEYNIGFSDFTIPGFKGTSKEKTFYARSKTEMTGGFKGESVIVPEETIILSEKKLETMVREKLQLALDAQVSLDFFVPTKDGSHIEILPIERINVPGEALQLKQKGVLRAPVIDRKEFSMAIANASLPDEQKGVGRVVNLDDLTYVFTPGELESDTIAVVVSGLGNLVWDIDEQEVVQIIEKTKKKDISYALQNTESIIKAEVSIRPFWRSKLPKKEKIHIIINNPQI